MGKSHIYILLILLIFLKEEYFYVPWNEPLYATTNWKKQSQHGRLTDGHVCDRCSQLGRLTAWLVTNKNSLRHRRCFVWVSNFGSNAFKYISSLWLTIVALDVPFDWLGYWEYPSNWLSVHESLCFVFCSEWEFPPCKRIHKHGKSYYDYSRSGARNIRIWWSEVPHHHSAKPARCPAHIRPRNPPSETISNWYSTHLFRLLLPCVYMLVIWVIPKIFQAWLISAVRSNRSELTWARTYVVPRHREVPRRRCFF